MILDANNYSEQYGVYERIRSAQVLADLKESNSLNAAAWDDLTQDIPYQKGNLLYHAYVVLYCITSHRIILCCIILDHVILSYVVLHHTSCN